LRALRHISLAAFIMIFAGFVFLSCSSDNGNNNPMAPGPGGADVTLTILGMSGANSFSPNPDTVTAGQTVAWKNNDSITHTATADGAQFNTGNIGAGKTSSPVTMNTVGSFPYHCSIHPSMVGTLVVKAAPLPTVTITIVGNLGSSSYSPNPDTVSVGQSVKWKNNDTMTHTATSDNGTTFDTGDIPAGATSAPITMNAAGSFPYHCSLHGGMIGTLVVKP
jgi:plastocyanin